MTRGRSGSAATFASYEAAKKTCEYIRIGLSELRFALRAFAHFDFFHELVIRPQMISAKPGFTRSSRLQFHGLATVSIDRSTRAMFMNSDEEDLTNPSLYYMPF
jgi:hypothetical protein